MYVRCGIRSIFTKFSHLKFFYCRYGCYGTYYLLAALDQRSWNILSGITPPPRHKEEITVDIERLRSMRSFLPQFLKSVLYDDGTRCR